MFALLFNPISLTSFLSHNCSCHVSAILTFQIAVNIFLHMQVTIECTERGQALAGLRQRYAVLLQRVPQRVLGLHTELVATRTLARRLLAELERMRDAMGTLTSALNEVQTDGTALAAAGGTAQSLAADATQQAGLVARALGDLQGLYELQRARLETRIVALEEECDSWFSHASRLSEAVMLRRGQQGVDRLRVSENERKSC